MIKKLRLNSKALSPIFATLVVLSIVTVLFIPVFAWAGGMVNSTRESWELSAAIATERIVIEQVNLAGATSPQTCKIYVRNIGENPTSISIVIISLENTVMKTYSPNEFSMLNPTTGSPTNSVTKGNLVQIQISNLNFALTNGKTYTIKVATPKGVSDNCLTVAAW